MTLSLLTKSSHPIPQTVGAAANAEAASSMGGNKKAAHIVADLSLLSQTTPHAVNSAYTSHN